MGNKTASRTQASPHPAGRVSVADALFTASQQRMLSLLFGQPERSFFTKELIELAGGGRGAVQRELERLLRSGLIVQIAVGNQKHYRANADAPIFAELRGIVLKTLGPAEVVRQALAPIVDQLLLALLYGSVAKRSDTALSDIDLLLVSDGLALEDAYAALVPAEKQLGRSISPTLYTPQELDRRLARGNPFLSKFLAGETITLVGDKDAFTIAG